MGYMMAKQNKHYNSIAKVYARELYMNCAGKLSQSTQLSVFNQRLLKEKVAEIQT